MKDRAKNLYIIRIVFVLTMMINGINILNAQNIHYTYDDAGNRIKKEIVTIVQVRKGDKDQQKFPDIDELSAEVKLKVNEAGDVIKVEIPDATADDLYVMEIYNISGFKVLDERYSGLTFEVRIADLPKGVYVVRLLNGNKSKIYKIIKE